ncbi:MAG: hypothetical protein ACMUJM_05285 [bacterium]
MVLLLGYVFDRSPPFLSYGHQWDSINVCYGVGHFRGAQVYIPLWVFMKCSSFFRKVAEIALWPKADMSQNVRR